MTGQRGAAVGGLPDNWLATELAAIDAAVATWPLGIRQSFDSLSTERIAAAAIILRVSRRVVSLPAPARHADIIAHAAKGVPESEWPVCYGGADQGFLTSRGSYVTRREAMGIAEAADQLLPCKDEDGVSFSRQAAELFSEDVW